MYDAFSLLMLKMFAVLGEIRNRDLSEVNAVQRIFGKSIKKNDKSVNTNSNAKNSTRVFSNHR